MSKVNKNATEHEFVTPDEEPAAKNNETKAEKFIRLGEYRMNKAIDAIGRLEHLANKSAYEYTAEQVYEMLPPSPANGKPKPALPARFRCSA